MISNGGSSIGWKSPFSSLVWASVPVAPGPSELLFSPLLLGTSAFLPSLSSFFKFCSLSPFTLLSTFFSFFFTLNLLFLSAMVLGFWKVGLVNSTVSVRRTGEWVWQSEIEGEHGAKRGGRNRQKWIPLCAIIGVEACLAEEGLGGLLNNPTAKTDRPTPMFSMPLLLKALGYQWS